MLIQVKPIQIKQIQIKQIQIKQIQVKQIQVKQIQVKSSQKIRAKPTPFHPRGNQPERAPATTPAPAYAGSRQIRLAKRPLRAPSRR